jgi:hypothetical protein
VSRRTRADAWLATCWTLRKPNRGEATCEVWSHPLGRELRLSANREQLRSQVFRDLAWTELAVQWREAMKEKGWTEPSNSEPIGVP